MKVILVKERGQVRILEGNKTVVTERALSLRRRRRSSGQLKYYVFDYKESLGMKLEAFITVLNMYPHVLEKSHLIRKI